MLLEVRISLDVLDKNNQNYIWTSGTFLDIESVPDKKTLRHLEMSLDTLAYLGHVWTLRMPKDIKDMNGQSYPKTSRTPLDS